MAQPQQPIRIRPGDSVSQRVNQILKHFTTTSDDARTTQNQVVTLINAEPSSQKLISILELAKSRLAEAAKQDPLQHEQVLHQYNKLEYSVSSKPPKSARPPTETDLPAGVDKKQKTEFMYPKLTIKLSRSTLPLTEEDGWTHQTVG